MKQKIKDILKISSVPVVVASLCCLSPVILVLFGISTVGFGSFLADTLYGEYKWAFRAIGFLALIGALVYYFRTVKGVCSLDDAKKRRTEIINYTILSLIAGFIGYIIFLYVIVHYIGVFMGLWA